MSRITKRCTKNRVFINTKKTKYLVFCNQCGDPDPSSVMINNAAIERVEEYKCLGTTISCKLYFNANTRNITDKVNKRVFIIKTACVYECPN